MVLMSDITLTSKAVYWCMMHLTPRHGRQQGGPKGHQGPLHLDNPAAMWRLDLRQLLQQPDPRLDMRVVRGASKRSAQELIDLASTGR
jgi:hypothetical protein